MEGIQVSVEKIGIDNSVAIIRVGGYIDTTTSSELERALDILLKDSIFMVIIDLAKVDYISSAGWGIFISEIKGIRERGGDLKLARMIADVYEVFELLEFHFILKAFDTIEEAIESFNIPQEKVSPSAIAKAEGKLKDDTVSDGVNAETVEEKIQSIVKENPSWNASKISKELNNEKYDFISIDKATVKKILKEFDLGNKKQRQVFSGE